MCSNDRNVGVNLCSLIKRGGASVEKGRGWVRNSLFVGKRGRVGAGKLKKATWNVSSFVGRPPIGCDIALTTNNNQSNP